MNPIGQAFPVINRAYAFSSYFDQEYFTKKKRTNLDLLSIPRLWGEKKTQNTREA